MNQLQNIEQQFNFRYPDLYHQLYADGLLNWGTFGPDWMSSQYPELRKNPPLLLFANEFELCNFEAIQEQMEEFTDPGYWMQINPDMRFVPFAKNGAGDMYCFFLKEQEEENIPIVFLWHDANRVEYKARNLQDFIFRSMLESVADIEEAAYGLLGPENFQQDLQHYLRTHGPYLTQQQQDVIGGIYQTTSNDKPLINETKLNELLQEVIGFENLDKEFPYQQR